jgi:putative ABC transport system permease protein
MYIPYNQVPIGYWTFVVRSTADPATVLAGARAQLAMINPQLAISDGASLAHAVGASAAQPRLDAWVVSAFGAVALLLAVVGIYGVIAYAVRDRYRELGIRLALGARSGQVVSLVLRQGAMMSAAGVSIGVVLAVLGNRVLRNLLYDIAPTDALTYVFIAGLAASVAIVAAWVPARRAAMVDPVIAMRSE